MPEPAIYAFRQSGSLQVYYCLDGARRFQIKSESERVQMGIDSTQVHVLDVSNPLNSLPIANP